MEQTTPEAAPQPKKTPTKTSFYVVLLAVAVIIFVLASYYFLSFESKKSCTEPATIRVAYQEASISSSPFILGKAKDLFQDESFRVKYIPLKSSSDVEQALVTNQADVSCAGAIRTVTAISQDVPVKIIATASIATNNLYTREGEEVSDLTELAGKTVGLSSPGGGKDLALRYALKQAGADPNNVTIEKVKKELQAQALIGKKAVDALVVSKPLTIKELEKEGAVKSTLWEDYRAEYKWPSSAISIHEKFLQKNATAVKAFIEDYKKAHEFIANNPDQAAQIVAEEITKASDDQVTITTNEVMDFWTVNQLTPWYDPATVKMLADLAFEVGFLGRQTSLDEIYDMRFKDLLSK